VVTRVGRLVAAALMSLWAPPPARGDEPAPRGAGWVRAEAIARGHLARHGVRARTVRPVAALPFLFRVDETRLLLVRADAVVPAGGGLRALEAHLRATDRDELPDVSPRDLIALVDYFAALPIDVPPSLRVAFVDAPDAPELSPRVSSDASTVRLVLSYVERPALGATPRSGTLAVQRRELEIARATGAARWVASRVEVRRPEGW